MAIERDIYDVQELVSANADDIVSNAEDITEIERTVLDLNSFHSLPWYSKSNVVYEYISDLKWDNSSIPDNGVDMFVRRVPLSLKYSSVVAILPSIGAQSRHASINLEPGKAAVHVTTNPMEATRLSSFEFEWLPPGDNSGIDIAVGHAALMAKPPMLSNFLFGSDTDSGLMNSKSVVFPNGGAFYVQSIYLDNGGINSELVLVGQKFYATTSTTLEEFEIYGIQ
jgi:hypothetical protein